MNLYWDRHHSEYRVESPALVRHYCWLHLPRRLMEAARDLNRRKLEEIGVEV